jgi:hypothetical protein
MDQVIQIDTFADANSIIIDGSGNVKTIADLSTLGSLKLVGDNGQVLEIVEHAVSTGTMSGSTATASAVFPAGCMALGLTIHPTTAITSGTGTTYKVGDGTDDDRWGTGIAFANNVTMADAVVTAPVIFATAKDVILTVNTGTFSGGVCRVTGYYIKLTAATS